MLANYSINDRIQVHITRVIPPGLLGRVVESPQQEGAPDEGPLALVRKREVAWTRPGSLKAYVGRTLPALAAAAPMRSPSSCASSSSAPRRYARSCWCATRSR